MSEDANLIELGDKIYEDSQCDIFEIGGEGSDAVAIIEKQPPVLTDKEYFDYVVFDPIEEESLDIEVHTSPDTSHMKLTGIGDAV